MRDALSRLALSCLEHVPRKRIALLPAFRQLRDLEALHCQSTVPEGQLELLRARMAELHAQADIAEHRQASQLRTCCVCYDDVQSVTGLTCPDAVHAANNRHFVCGSCADRYVCEALANDRARVCCVGADCAALYAERSLAVALPDATFARYLFAKEARRVRVALDEDRARVRAKEQRRQAQQAEDREAEERRQHVIMHILDQACPRYLLSHTH